MKTIARILTTAAVAGSVAALGQPASAMKTSVFEGITRHVSTTNIKVENPKSHQTLAFTILPKFDRVFSDDGKTTMQMAAIKPGQYVKVYFDQKLLGVRHADRILIMTSGNMVKAKE